MERELMVNGQAYVCVVSQRGQGFVYKGADGYLRLGPPARIRELVRRHRLLADSGAPVARILAEGTIGESAYYVEESLGDERYGRQFRREWEAGGISEDAFRRFVEMTLRFTHAQIAGGASFGDADLEAGIHLGLARAEAPELSPRLATRFAQAARRLSRMPVVACHGDFNPQNVLPHGVIDFEDMFSGPLGYDQVSGIYTTELNPEGDYEYPARYRFTADQIRAYYETFDAFFESRSLPSLSSVRRDLEFCRSVWAATRMGEWPKTRAWRYAHLETFFDVTIAS